jgi:hypothetical protein
MGENIFTPGPSPDTVRKEAAACRRDKAQAEHVEDFFGAVVAFPAFHPNYAELARTRARTMGSLMRDRRPGHCPPATAGGTGTRRHR